MDVVMLSSGILGTFVINVLEPHSERFGGMLFLGYEVRYWKTHENLTKMASPTLKLAKTIEW